MKTMKLSGGPNLMKTMKLSGGPNLMKTMKLSLLTLLVILGAGYSHESLAQHACGGTIVHSSDCDNSPREYAISCCPEGYRVQGFAYTDIKDADYVDAGAAVCRSIKEGNLMMPSSDFQRTPARLECKTNEVVAGLFCKDVLKSGKMLDELDGCTVLCQSPGSQELRREYNSDIAGGREGGELFVYLPQRVVGIACKELGAKESDRADCCTIITQSK